MYSSIQKCALLHQFSCKGRKESYNMKSSIGEACKFTRLCYLFILWYSLNLRTRTNNNISRGPFKNCVMPLLAIFYHPVFPLAMPCNMAEDYVAPASNPKHWRRFTLSSSLSCHSICRSLKKWGKNFKMFHNTIYMTTSLSLLSYRTSTFTSSPLSDWKFWMAPKLYQCITADWFHNIDIHIN